MGREPPSDVSDQQLWRQSCTIDVAEDEAERYLDLAGFADGLLDPDEHERIAERIDRDADAAADIAAARAPADPSWHATISDTAITAACALVGGDADRTGEVIPFQQRRRAKSGLQAFTQWGAQWGSLAAAVAVAGWLGFTLGMDTLGDLTQNNRSGDDSFLNELIDPPGGILRDLTEGPRT